MMRQQLRELSITSRPASSRPSMTHQVPRSPLSISGPNSPALLGQLQLPLSSPLTLAVTGTQNGEALGHNPAAPAGTGLALSPT